jgi:hypothetical protein
MKFKTFIWRLKLYFKQENFGIKVLICNYYFSPLNSNTYMRNEKYSDSDPDQEPDLDPYLWLTDPDRNRNTGGGFGWGLMQDYLPDQM